MPVFTVEKNTLPTYWWACAGHITEHVGDKPNGDNYYHTRNEAYRAAFQLQRSRFRREYDQLVAQGKGIGVRILRIRAWWNSHIAKLVQDYDAKVANAKYLAGYPGSLEIDVTTEYVPDTIPVKGERIAIGTRVYDFDNHSLILTVAQVTEEHIDYYAFRPEGVAATYRLSNGRYIKSDLESGFCNSEQYLDKDAANTRMREAVSARIAELQEQLK